MTRLGAGRLRQAAPAALLFATIVCLSPGTIAGQRAFFERDTMLWWSAQAHVFGQALREGAWPFWNRYAGFGQPLLADATAQGFYPPTWLLAFVEPWRYYGWYVVAHLALGALGVSALARRFGVSGRGAWTAAFAFLLSGPFLSLVIAWNHLAGAAWMPWVLATAEDMLAGRERPGLAWRCGVLAGFQLLTGSPDMCLLTGGVCLALVLRRAHRDGVRLLAPIARAAATALGVSAVQWVPSLDAAWGTHRMALPSVERSMWSLHPIALAQIVVPFLTTTLAPLVGRYRVGRALVDPYLHSVYLGITAVGLVTASAWASSSGRRLLLAVAVIYLLFALGTSTPVYELLVTVLPPLATLRFPAKAATVVALCWAILAGMGIDAWKRATSHGVVLGPLLLCLAFGAFVAWRLPEILAAWAARLVAPSDATGFVQQAGPMRAQMIGALALGAAAALLVFLQRRTGRDLARGAALLLVVDLFGAGASVAATAPRERVERRPAVLAALSGAPQPRVYVWDYAFGVDPDRARFGSLITRLPPADMVFACQEYLFPPSAARFDVRGSFDLDTLGTQAPPTRALTRLLRQVEDSPAYLRLLQLGAVDYVLTLHAPADGGTPVVARVDGVFAEPIRVSRVADSRPRAYAVGAVRVATGDEATRDLLDPAFDPAREVVLEHDAPSRPPMSGDVRVVAETADRVELEADLDGDGYVVLVEGFDTYWRATVDGKPVPVLRANGIFRAVAAGAGRHHVVMRYRPWPIPAGLGLSGLTWLALGVGAWRARRPQRSEAGGYLRSR